MPFHDFCRTRIPPGPGDRYWGVRGQITLPTSLAVVTDSDFIDFYIGFNTLENDPRVEAGFSHKNSIDGPPSLGRWHWFVTWWKRVDGSLRRFSQSGPHTGRSQASLALEADPPVGGLTHFRFYADGVLVWEEDADLNGRREVLPKYVSGSYQATPHYFDFRENERPIIGFSPQAVWNQVEYLRAPSGVWAPWTAPNTVTDQEANTHKDNDGRTSVDPPAASRFVCAHPAQYHERVDISPPASSELPPEGELIATIVRNAAGGASGKQIRVDGDRLIMIIDTSTEAELWRSNDGGFNWSFYAIPNSAGLNRGLGIISEPFEGFLWTSSGVIFGGQKRTPGNDPGPTWEEEGAPSSTVSGQPGQPSNGYLHSQVLGLDSYVMRRIGPETHISTGSHGAGDPRGMRVIPGTGDLLALYNQPVKVFRITPSDPMLIVNQAEFPEFTFSNPNFPNPNFDVLTASDYYVGVSGGGGGSDLAPVVIKKTTDGGASWQNTQLAAGFWSGQTGDLEISGVTTCFVRYGGQDYAMVTRQNLPRVRLARFNPGTSAWDAFSAESNIAAKFSGAGVDTSGALQFYFAEYDAVSQTTNVYRYSMRT